MTLLYCLFLWGFSFTNTKIQLYNNDSISLLFDDIWVGFKVNRITCTHSNCTSNYVILEALILCAYLSVCQLVHHKADKISRAHL